MREHVPGYETCFDGLIESLEIGLFSTKQAKERDYLVNRITELIKRKQSQLDDEFSDGIISRCNAALDELLSILSIFYDTDYFSDHDWEGNEIKQIKKERENDSPQDI